MSTPALVEPAYVNERDRVVVTAAGDHARIAFKDDADEIVDTWRSLRALRVLETDANAPVVAKARRKWPRSADVRLKERRREP